MALTFSAAFDDSNSHKDAPLILWAGFAGFENQWSFLQDGWRAILKREQLPYFHMYKCERGEPPFDRKDPQRAWRDSITHDLRQVIFKSGLFGIACGVPHADWERVVTPDIAPWVGAPGSVCLTVVQASSIQRAAAMGWRNRITTIYDQGVEDDAKQSIWHSNNIINAHQGRDDGVGILPVKTTPALQAADMLAWELQHDMKNYMRLGPTRPIRPHFKP